MAEKNAAETTGEAVVEAAKDTQTAAESAGAEGGAEEAPAEAAGADAGAEEAPAADFEELEDEPENPEAVSQAPPRNHESLVSQFEMKWGELKAFSNHLEGDLDGELGEALALARKYEG